MQKNERSVQGCCDLWLAIPVQTGICHSPFISVNFNNNEDIKSIYEKELSSIGPLRTGIVLGILYGLLGLIFVASFSTGMAMSRQQSQSSAAAFWRVFFAVLFPLLHSASRDLFSASFRRRSIIWLPGGPAVWSFRCVIFRPRPDPAGFLNVPRDYPTKILFVCSRNRIRSLTAEKIFEGVPGLQIRSAGTQPDARVVVTEGHIGWADIIFAMERSHLNRLRLKFGDALAGKLDGRAPPFTRRYGNWRWG